MKLKFSVPDGKKIRVILDTDAACEADDQFAIAHALMTPRFDIRGLVAEQFYSEGGENSVEASYREILNITRLMGLENVYTVCRGAALPLKNETRAEMSDGAWLIIQEALADSAQPLFVLCQGALTNMASALLLEPQIASRLTCIWIGGGVYPDGNREFNLGNDICAANVVFDSDVELWQVPMNCYTTMRIGYAELQMKVRPCGRIGRYLFDQMMELAHSPRGWWTNGESWSLGDSPAVGLALHPAQQDYELRAAPRVDSDCRYIPGAGRRRIHVYRSVDTRYILEDFFAKLALLYGDEKQCLVF